LAKTIAGRAEVLPLLAEVFRAHGYEGTTLALLTEATGLGKGSLYHFFPGGKEQMASEVLAEIDAWFEVNVFVPLLKSDDAKRAIAGMVASVETYFRAGKRMCLLGVVAVGASRDFFAQQVHSYFKRWSDALTSALRRAGETSAAAKRKSEDALLVIQGALVLARALDDSRVFTRAMADLKDRLLA
jgi:AcrR family transcriptional regulator